MFDISIGLSTKKLLEKSRSFFYAIFFYAILKKHTLTLFSKKHFGFFKIELLSNTDSNVYTILQLKIKRRSNNLFNS
jgi:hypothetical protein